MKTLYATARNLLLLPSPCGPLAAAEVVLTFGEPSGKPGVRALTQSRFVASPAELRELAEDLTEVADQADAVAAAGGVLPPAPTDPEPPAAEAVA